MLRIAICDDEKQMREALKGLTESCVDAVVDLFADGEALLDAGIEFDIILLDICMEEAGSGRLNGIETAKRIRKKSDAVIIFITALKEYVFEAYDVEAFHYLLKPVDEPKLREVLEKAAAKREERKGMEPLTIKMNGISKRIPIEDIYYAENDRRKIILHTKNGNDSFYGKMEDLEQKLGNRFFRSHRGYLVHLEEVESYDHTNIFLKNGEMVFLARQKYNDFVTAYMHHLTRQR